MQNCIRASLKISRMIKNKDCTHILSAIFFCGIHDLFESFHLKFAVYYYIFKVTKFVSYFKEEISWVNL